MNIGIDQLESALAGLNVLTAFLDAEFRFVRVNAAYAAAAGKTPDFFVGRKHFDLYPDSENEALFRRVLESGEPLTVRGKAFEHPDQPGRGTTYWDWSLQRIAVPGSPMALALILIDVTEPVRAARQAEQYAQGIAAEQEQVKLLGTALAAASTAIMITDRAGAIVWVNAAFRRLSGYAEGELLGRTPNILQSGQQGESHGRGLWQTLLGGKTWAGETIDRRKDGSEYTVRQTITPIVDVDGEVTHFVTLHEDITERTETQARILHMAHHDLLTGLPNRLLFFDRILQACSLAARDKFDITLLYMDLDGFKAVNDTLGHDAGDLLLQEVSKRMLACIRASDTLARLGGDEFGIILFDGGGHDTTERIAEKVIGEIGRPFRLGEHEANIGVSIGIALGGTICDQKELLRRADVAMYAAKRAGKHGFCWYEGDGRPSSPDG